MIMNNNNYNNDNKDNIFRWYKNRIFSSMLILKFFTQYNGLLIHIKHVWCGRSCCSAPRARETPACPDVSRPLASL